MWITGCYNLTLYAASPVCYSKIKYEEYHWVLIAEIHTDLKDNF